MSFELLPAILIISQAIQKNNLTLMHGVGLKKKGEDEVSVRLSAYYNKSHRVLLIPHCNSLDKPTSVGECRRQISFEHLFNVLLVLRYGVTVP